MVLAELRQLAGELNIPDIAGMRKGDLIAAIKEKQGAPPSRKRSAAAQPTLPGTDGVPAAAEAPAAPAATEAPAASAEAPAVNGTAPATDTAGALVEIS